MCDVGKLRRAIKFVFTDPEFLANVSDDVAGAGVVSDHKKKSHEPWPCCLAHL